MKFNQTDVKRVERMYSEKQCISLRYAAKWLLLSKRMISNIVKKKLLKKAYKAKIRLKLTEQQRLTRIHGSQQLLQRTEILGNVWFSDESWF